MHQKRMQITSTAPVAARGATPAKRRARTSPTAVKQPRSQKAGSMRRPKRGAMEMQRSPKWRRAENAERPPTIAALMEMQRSPKRRRTEHVLRTKRRRRAARRLGFAPWCRGTLPLALSCPAQYRNVASTSSAHAPSGSLATIALTRWTFRRARASSRTRRALASSGQTMSTWHSARPCGGCGKSTRCISRGAFSLSTCRRR